MALRRVVVSSLGQVSPLGTNVTDAWNALCAAKIHSTDPVWKVSSSLDVQDHYLDMQLTKEPQFAWTLASAVEAYEIGKLDPDEKLQQRMGLVTTNSCSSMQSLKDLSDSQTTEDINRNLGLTLFPGILTGTLAHALKLRGPTVSFTGFDNSGLNAIGEGYNLIQRREADIVLVGGCSPTYDQHLIMSLEGRMTDSVNYSEAAGVIILEDYEHAVNRKARLLAEIRGFSNYTLNDFDEKIKKEIITDMMSSAKVDKPSLAVIDGYSLYHEGSFIKKLYPNTKISSFRKFTGYSLGATSLLESIFTVMCLKQGVIPGLYSSTNKTQNHVVQKITKQKLDSALVVSQSFTGEFSSIILSKLE